MAACSTNHINCLENPLSNHGYSFATAPSPTGRSPYPKYSLADPPTRTYKCEYTVSYHSLSTSPSPAGHRTSNRVLVGRQSPLVNSSSRPFGPSPLKPSQAAAAPSAAESVEAEPRRLSTIPSFLTRLLYSGSLGMASYVPPGGTQSGAVWVCSGACNGCGGYMPERGTARAKLGL
ncbi:hypothetical protein VTI74DRAFT_8233 [Chaetomium olivicolor]